MADRKKKKRQKMPINREILRWARERLKLSAEDVADEASVKPEQVNEWEAGSKVPTVLQARRLAEIYERPFLEFFAKEKPALKDPALMPDFRMHREESSKERHELILKICSKYPDKAEEIITGSLPAIDANGIVCIESTAHGQEGAFYDMALRAQEQAETGKPLAKSDYRFHFAPWWEAEEYEADPTAVVVSSVDSAYFGRLEADIGREVGPRKRAWYVGKRDADFSGDSELMMREYPGTPEEAFAQSVEGVFLADQLSLARREGRITFVPHDPTAPVNTFWDLHHGGEDSVCIWFHQRYGLRDHWIRFIEGSGEAYSFYIKQMQALGYVWGKHYLPHDAGRRFPGAEVNPTIADMLDGLGLKNIEIVPRVADLSAGINEMREDFGSYWFDEKNCAEGLRHLGLYRKEWNDRLGCWREKPREDGHQHAADALRQKAQGWSAPVRLPNRKRRRSAMAA